MSHFKLSVLCICGVLLLAQSGLGVNLVQNPGFETTSAEPNHVCANWTRTYANATGTVDASLSAGGGLGGSNALYLSTTGGVGDTSGSNGAWQIIPVVTGKKYQVHGQWKGDISVQTLGTSCSALVEVYVGFGISPTTKASSETCIYRKRNQYGSTNIYNVDPNGAVWDWRDIGVSPNLGWDGGDTVVATGPYMTVRFAMSANNQTATDHVYIDNVTVQGCQEAIGLSDITGDCNVSFKDMAVVGRNWLNCGVTPSSLCW